TVRTLRDFVVRTLETFQTRALDLAETDAARAVAYYNANHTEIRDRRDKLFADFAQQVDRVLAGHEARAHTTSIICFSLMSLVLILCIIVGRFQSSAVTVPLNRLVGALERMRQGDFTDRLSLNRADEFGVLNDGLNRLADDLSELV